MRSSRKSSATILRKRDVDVLENHTEIKAKEARANFSRVINAARYDDESMVITDHGEPAAALVPIKDLRVLDILDNLGLLNTVRGRQFKDFTLEDFRKLIDSQELASDKGEDPSNDPNLRHSTAKVSRQGSR